MNIENLTFSAWQANHPPDHDDKWCRELYPFNVFRLIDFDEQQIGVQQKIDFNRTYYYAIINKTQVQDNGRYKTTFDISTYPMSKSQSWKHRSWNSTFQIVYTKDYKFITVFTKKEDPSKDYVVRFMKGNFQKITDDRSLPLSELLFKTLLLHISEENYTNGQYNRQFQFEPNGVRHLPEHPQFKRNGSDFAPVYSVERDIWICYAFSEEKAHRIAFFNADQCLDLMVVYCNPTYTKHHRCKYEHTRVLSLYEYASLLSSEVRKKYEPQIRFLQNHLNNQQQSNIEDLLKEIHFPKNEKYEITKPDLMEALGVMKIMPENDTDFFHSLVSVNLINAFIGQQRKGKTLRLKETNLFRNMYFFKTYLANILTKRILDKSFSNPIYIKDNLIMIEVFNLQFSFHHIPLNDTLREYEFSINNKEIIWCGKRLQPIAPILLYYSRALRLQNTTR